MKGIGGAGAGRDGRRADGKRCRETLSSGGPSTDRLSTTRDSYGRCLGPTVEGIDGGAGFASDAGKPRRNAGTAGAIAGQGGHSHITIEGTRTHPKHAFQYRTQRASSKEKHRAMKLNARIPLLVGLMVILGTATGCNFLKSRDQLNKGIAAFKNGQYEQATSYFQTAAQLDPKNDNAKLYLATTYASQVVPGLMDPANLAMAQKALDGFNAVLAKNPNDLTALKQIASIDRNINKLDQAKADELQVIKLAPNEPEAYYIVGFVDWKQAYNNAVTILAADGLTDAGDGNPKMTKGACAKIQAANAPLVAEGIQNLEKAVDLNPNYDDAMQYLQLTYRRKADLDCGNAAARQADMAQVDSWTQRAMGARKTNELNKEKKLGGGVTM